MISTILYPRDFPNSFVVGDEIIVLDSKGIGSKEGGSFFGRGIVESDIRPDGPYSGRHTVRYCFGDNSCFNVRPERMLSVIGASHCRRNVDRSETFSIYSRLIVCRETFEYRRLASSQVRPGDVVIEIGSDFGLTTSLLDSAASGDFWDCLRLCQHPVPISSDISRRGRVIGIDKSSEHVESSSLSYPHISFLSMDLFIGESSNLILRDISDKLQAKLTKSSFCPCGCLKMDSCSFCPAPRFLVFLDINGSRDLIDVENAINLVMKHINPSIVVVKSRNLANKMMLP